MRPDEFRILYQDTDAGPYDGGASGSQTTFNNGRAVIAAANEIREQLLDLAADFLEANRADLELVDGMVRVKGSGTSSVTIADLASEAAGAGCCSAGAPAQPPPTPAVNAASCVGRLGGESFAAPTFFTHAARVKVDRDTGVVRVLEIAASHESGMVINPIGAAGQIHGGVAMGIGQALSEGVLLTDDGRQRNPYLLDYKLQTAADVPPMTVDFVDAPLAERRSQGPQGHRRATMRPDARGDRERDRPGHRRAGPGAADDAGAGLRRDRVGEVRGLTWTCGSRLRRRSRTPWRPRPPGAGRSPAGRTSSWERGRGNGRSRRTSSRWTGSRSCAGSPGPRAASGSGRRRATPSWPVTRTSGHAGRPSRTPPRSSARRPRATSGRSAATSPTRRRPPRRAGRCSCFKAEVEVRSTTGDRRIALGRPVHRSGPDDASIRTS